MNLSSLIDKVRPSATLAVAAKANELKAKGVDIISMSTGEPDFDTPEHIKDAAIAAIKSGKTKYTAVDGTAELKQAIIDKFACDNQLSYQPNQILVSTGAKQSIFNALGALLNPGDEVIIPAPYWVSYPDMVILSGGKPVIIPTTIEQKFKIDATSLQAAITTKTKLVILNSPSNPAGVSYSRQELEDLSYVLEENSHVAIITDDIYEHTLWINEPFCNILMANPNLIDRTIVVNGVSKSYAMTGWRIGYAGGPQSIIAAMKKIQSQSTSNACSISQAAATAALTGDQKCITEMCTVFKKRHNFLIEKLNNFSGIRAIASDGTFYCFADFNQIIENSNMQNDIELSTYLLEHGIALVPGSAFGMPGYLRFSYATSDENIIKAIDRLNLAINSIN